MAIYLGNTLLTGPSGGGGDASLSADQTFTGANTFSNAGGIQTNRVTGIGDTDTYLDISGTLDNVIIAYAGNVAALSVSNGAVTVNPLATDDMSFTVNKETTGVGISFNGPTDTLSSDAANIGGNLPPAVPTVDGDYKLVVSGGTVTWQTI